MTLSEFKAWFEGFTESIPANAGFNPEQTKRIRARVKEITDTPITWPIYVDHWVEPYRRYYSDLNLEWVSRAGDVPPGALWTSNSADASGPMLLAGRAEAASLVIG